MISSFESTRDTAMHNSGLPRGLRRLLRTEGAAALVVAATAYAVAARSWGFFALCFFVPDLSMLGYVGGPRVGAMIYNLVHSYLVPLALLGVALPVFGAASTQAAIAYIWLAHIGFDRALGYGLKDVSGFHSTHLGTIGGSGSQRAATR